MENISTNINFTYNWNTTQYVEDTNHTIEVRGYTVDGGKELIGQFSVLVNNIPDEEGG